MQILKILQKKAKSFKFYGSFLNIGYLNKLYSALLHKFIFTFSISPLGSIALADLITILLSRV